MITSIRLENLSFGYQKEKPVFTDLSLTIPTGRNLLIEGEPGQGTSTFLKLLAVVHQPQAGKLLINDCDTSQMTFEEFLPFRMKIGYTFDYGGLFSNRSLLDNLTLPLLYHKICDFDEARARGIEMANHFGFYNKLVERPASVTGGLRKLVSVVRTMLMNPEMVVMDDPFMGVDRSNVAKLITMLNERRERGDLKHLYLTSQEISYAQQLGCESVLLSDGRFHFRNQEAA